MKKIEENSVILRFSDNDNVIHDIGLDSILEGGMPIDEESGEDLEYLGVYVLDAIIEPNDQRQATASTQL